MRVRAHDRRRALALARAGASNKAIAAELGVTEPTVSRWLRAEALFEPSHVRGAVRSATGLSPSERDVLERALLGATAAQIADARGTSTRTIANQLRRAYRALGATSRRTALARLQECKK